jgi:hypothetical protein
LLRRGYQNCSAQNNGWACRWISINGVHLICQRGIVYGPSKFYQWKSWGTVAELRLELQYGQKRHQTGHVAIIHLGWLIKKDVI